MYQLSINPKQLKCLYYIRESIKKETGAYVPITKLIEKALDEFIPKTEKRLEKSLGLIKHEH